MQRAIIKLKDASFINICANAIDLRDGWVMAWYDDMLVAIVRGDEVEACYLSEKKKGGEDLSNI